MTKTSLFQNKKYFIFLIITVFIIFSTVLFSLPSSADTSVEEDSVTSEDIIENEALEEETQSEEIEYQSNFFATFWALLPPLIAIVLALITKEVYISLFVGIITGALLYSNFNPEKTIRSIFEVMTTKLGDSWNVGILIFLVFLGIIVSLITKAGGSAAYGKWASSKIKSKKGALLATFGLGVLIFVDDYFNCLTVGSVMRPVTDKFKISRAKLAYIIDATAAPICIIAPISSWAAAVTSSTEGTGIDGFQMFIKAIPYNFYALLTIVMIITITLLKFDFGPMKKSEYIAENGIIGADSSYETSSFVSPKGSVLDLIIPIASLIVCCILGMVYTGGFFEGVSFVDAFAGCDASVGLVLGSFIALLITFILYIPRKIITYKQFTESIPEGFKAMIPAILILIFAWTLSGFCRDNLGAGEFVSSILEGNTSASSFLPALLFLIALGLAFATGTSWGTFGILIPIVIAVFPEMSEILVISISACLAGAVCGDHISPISDTTIMSSAGAQVNHIEHVSTQIPYALLVAAISFIGYFLAGFIRNFFIVLPISIVLMIFAIFVMKLLFARKHA